MSQFFCSTLEFFIIIPGLLIAYLPMKQHLRIPKHKLALWMTLLILMLCLAAGGICCFFSVRALWLFFPIVAIVGLFYVHTLDITHWKSVSVFLAVCGTFSCLSGVANAIDTILCPENTTALSLGAVISYHLMCWGILLVVWYPATHAARYLLEEESFAPTWYVFWILPTLFIGLNLFLLPSPATDITEAFLHMYIIISLALLILLLLFYAMFYLIATSLNHNNHLCQENQFLSMQQARYDSLRAAIAETREARHDMRHHFNFLQGLAAHQEWEKLTAYLSKAVEDIPNTDLNLCDNTAADVVAAHYMLLFQKYQIPCSFELDLPYKLPVPESDLCLTLSNLLENAMEASLKTSPGKRRIHVQAYLHSNHMVLITVENTFDGIVKEKNGTFQSSKRRGEGIGIQSIRHIAEKNGGYSRFLYENGIFCANVMLRSET